MTRLADTVLVVLALGFVGGVVALGWGLRVAMNMNKRRGTA